MGNTYCCSKQSPDLESMNVKDPTQIARNSGAQSRRKSINRFVSEKIQKSVADLDPTGVCTEKIIVDAGLYS